jgi:ribosomal protein S17
MAVKERVGTVVSNKMSKTVVVAVENRSPHPNTAKSWCVPSAIKPTMKRISAKRVT